MNNASGGVDSREGAKQISKSKRAMLFKMSKFTYNWKYIFTARERVARRIGRREGERYEGMQNSRRSLVGGEP